MALQTFSAGSFNNYEQLVEWDGSNHDEILTWIHGLDHWTTDPALRWRITAVSDRQLTLCKPEPAEPDHDQEVIIGIGEWIWAFAPEPNRDRLVVQRLDPTGKWKTDDQHGRPPRVDALLVGNAQKGQR